MMFDGRPILRLARVFLLMLARNIHVLEAGLVDLGPVWAARDYPLKGERNMQNSAADVPGENLGVVIRGVDTEGMPIYAEDTQPVLVELSSERNVLGVRPDVFGWAFMHENERYNDALKPDWEPGNRALCPFCCKQVGEGSRVRTFMPQRVVLREGLLAGSESSRLRFFYRYHETCFEKTADIAIEQSLKDLAPKEPKEEA